MPDPAPPRIDLPSPSLVVLVGASSSGKSTFAARHFRPDEVLGSDAMRAWLSGDETDQSVTGEAFGSLHRAASARLTQGRLTVIDATSVRPRDRLALVQLARAHDLPAVAVVFDLPRSVLEARHAARPDRPFGSDVILRQLSDLRRTQGGLTQEGFRHVWTLRSEAEVNAAQVTPVPLRVDRRDLSGPFDVIGDVHGCLSELRALLLRLGYCLDGGQVSPPSGRTAVFLGDLVDRGPDSAGVLRLVMGMVSAGTALCLPGNHEEKVARALDGKAVKLVHGLDATLAQIEAGGSAFRREVRAFIGSLPSHLVLDGGRLVVAHAGLPEPYHGRTSGRVRSFALFGDVDGTRDELGFPVRRDWAAGYAGAALVVYGHTPHTAPRWVGNTVNIDTGCAFGGALTALRYPERETLSLPAQAVYAVLARPLPPP
ncbi:serine/threonine protein phosphatase [Deinococcus sp. KSM4-11]|uniref:AAA family ATPase n=1 Tax=Deinococcus sp. KSM4-11 TaxID=2568654 RepID=UPI0010A51468|nr:AAA family ATPase [Deinococcus sp. KSM4-11]THF85246.1 serine/threonine protein phosphatase [Deinococcus sp. KSM4-11]